MKKTFVFTALLFAVTSAVNAQSADAIEPTSFGIRAGINFQNLNGKDAEGDKLENDVITAFHAGVNAEVPLAPEFYLQPGLLFSLKGASGLAQTGAGDLKINLSYLELPINFVYRPALGQGHLLLGFGPYLGYALGGKYKAGDQEEDLEFGEDFKRFDMGANILAGYEFNRKFSAQLNAQLGLTKINEEAAGDGETAVKNTGFGISVGYRFRK